MYCLKRIGSMIFSFSGLGKLGFPKAFRETNESAHGKPRGGDVEFSPWVFDEKTPPPLFKKKDQEWKQEKNESTNTHTHNIDNYQ